MFLVRKLFPLATTVIAALAFTASTASAQLEVHAEDQPVEECGTVTIDGAHHVEGGCRIEYESTEDISLVGYFPQPTILFNCLWHLEAQIGENGAGYITEAELTDEPDPPVPSCVRQACDEAAPIHETLAWPIQINEVAGVESIMMRICLRAGSPNEEPSAEGGAGSRCTLTFEAADLTGHDYEFGHHPGEEFCAPGDFPFAVPFHNAHFTNEVDPDPPDYLEDVEIIH